MKALLVGLLACVLVTQATAATTKAGTPAPRTTTKVEQRALTLDQRLDGKLAALRKHRGTVRFFETHRSLLVAGDQRRTFESRLAHARTRVRQLTRTVASLRAMIRSRAERRLESLPPTKAICAVFGSYCQEALAVAWCESGHRTTAQNGQYLGMFQMGTDARRMFGHGATPRQQAVAAYRLFVYAGKDWSPWSCRWAAY